MPPIKRSPRFLATLLLVAFLVACKSKSDGPPFPAMTPFPLEEAGRLHAIRDRIAAVRALSVGPEVQEGVVSRDALKEYLEESAKDLDAEERRKLETYNIAFRMMRLIDADDDLQRAYSTSYGEGVIGMYSPKDDRLVLVDDAKDGGPNEELTLAHEWVHALQDHAFDIEAFRKRGEDDRATELGRTLSCVVEGDATVASFRYMTQVYGPTWLSRVVGANPAGRDEPDVPEVVRRSMAFNYRECLIFVTAVLARTGWDGVNKLYEQPPVSTEQILHPNRFFNNEAPQDVITTNLLESLGSGWKKLESTVFGEFDVYNYLLAAKGPDTTVARGAETDAASAAEGWGGGRLSLYSQKNKNGQNVVVHIALEWDTFRDLDEFRRQYDLLLTSLAYEARSQNENGAIWQWHSAGEYGYALWAEETQRVDLLLGTDQPSVERARNAILTSSSD
jgi:hypothetical protein